MKTKIAKPAMKKAMETFAKKDKKDDMKMIKSAMKAKTAKSGK